MSSNAARNQVTASETLVVRRSPEAVFDFTQDYAHRTEWDSGVSEVEVLGDDPPQVRLTIRGLGRVTVAYRLFRRPERTSAAFVDVESRWIVGGGGSWQYTGVPDGTEWSQTNTLELRPGLAMRVLAPWIRRSLRSSMRTAMAHARERLEASGPPAAAPGGSG